MIYLDESEDWWTFFQLRWPPAFNFIGSTPWQDGKDTLWECVFILLQNEKLTTGLCWCMQLWKWRENVPWWNICMWTHRYCSFGNSKPFQGPDHEQFNDNYDYFYVKVSGCVTRIWFGVEDIFITQPHQFFNWMVLPWLRNILLVFPATSLFNTSWGIRIQTLPGWTKDS